MVLEELRGRWEQGKGIGEDRSAAPAFAGALHTSHGVKADGRKEAGSRGCKGKGSHWAAPAPLKSQN